MGFTGVFTRMGIDRTWFNPERSSSFRQWVAWQFEDFLAMVVALIITLVNITVIPFPIGYIYIYIFIYYIIPVVDISFWINKGYSARMEYTTKYDIFLLYIFATTVIIYFVHSFLRWTIHGRRPKKTVIAQAGSSWSKRCDRAYIGGWWPSSSRMEMVESHRPTNPLVNVYSLLLNMAIYSWFSH